MTHKVDKKLLISHKVWKRAHLIKPWFDQTFRWYRASTKHSSKRNLEHVHTLYVVQSRKAVCVSELLDAGWFVFTQLRAASSWSWQIHTAQHLVLISTGQHLPVDLVQNSKYFWVLSSGVCVLFVCFLVQMPKCFFFFCSHVLPVCSGEWQEGYWGLRPECSTAILHQVKRQSRVGLVQAVPGTEPAAHRSALPCPAFLSDGKNPP